MMFYRMLDKINGQFTEANPLKLGNVEFWKESTKDDALWCYDKITDLWDINAISTDIIQKLGNYEMPIL